MTRLLLNCITAMIAALTFISSVAFTLADEPPSLKFSKRFLMLSPNEGCAIADVDKDGDADVIAGTHWFAGPDFVPRPLRDIAEVHNV